MTLLNLLKSAAPQAIELEESWQWKEYRFLLLPRAWSPHTYIDAAYIKYRISHCLWYFIAREIWGSNKHDATERVRDVIALPIPWL